MATHDRFPLLHKILLLLGVSVLVGAAFLGTPDRSSAYSIDPATVTDTETPDPALAAADDHGHPQPEQAVAEPQEREEVYRVEPGDTLSAIFDDKGISVQVLHQLLAADAEYLALETLHPGTDLTFRFDPEGTLEELTLHLDPARKAVFSRQEDGTFAYQQIETETHWVLNVRQGTIHRSFFASGKQAGLTDRQIEEISHLLKSKIDFRREIREGDRFAALIAYEWTPEQETGRYHIDAVSFTRGRHTYNAFLYTDGNYYDENGESVLPAFLRWPIPRHYRVSSPFNPARVHPVTGRRTPHNGVDLATPVGTPILSTGDGIVTRIGNHPYAGKYINIRHNGSLSTRYLHLSRVLVKKGERVHRGQKIALSGNTGRTTGPHLHFELHIDGRPVNPLTADIPTATRVPADALASFNSMVHERLAYLQDPGKLDTLYASAPSNTGPETGEKTVTR
jgi:murein DD-endopeptidase